MHPLLCSTIIALGVGLGGHRAADALLFPPVGLVPGMAIEHQAQPETPTYTDQFGNALPKWRTDQGYFAEPNRTYTWLPLPRPITRQDLNLWGDILLLSDAQRAQMNRLFEECAERELAFHMDRVQKLWDDASDLVSGGPIGQDVARAEALARLEVVQCARARRELEAIEREFFNGLAAGLAETQIPRLQAVNRLRRRDAYAYPPRFPGVEFDLTLTLHRMRRDGVDVKPSDPELFDELVLGYDVSLTSLIVRRGQQKARLAGEAMVAHARRNELGAAAEGTPAAEAREAEIRRCHRRIVQLERPIFNLNREYVTLLGSLLPDETAQQLETRLLRRVYPSVYPDPTAANALLTGAAQLDGLSPEQQEQIESIRSWYRPMREDVCRRMARRYLQWREYVAVKWGYDPKKRAAFDKDMRHLHHERVELARAAAAQLGDILSEEQWEALSRLRSHLERKLEDEYVPDPALEH